MIGADDFTGEHGFNVHTRWIETEFAGMPAAEKRPDPAPDPALVRTHIEIDGRRHAVAFPASLLAASRMPEPDSSQKVSTTPAPGVFIAPMTGVLRSWKVGDGQQVRAGDVLAILEAMKMEIQITAPHAGSVRCIAKEGDLLDADAIVGRIDL